MLNSYGRNKYIEHEKVLHMEFMHIKFSRNAPILNKFFSYNSKSFL